MTTISGPESIAALVLALQCVAYNRPTDISRRAVLHAAAIRAHKRQRDRQAGSKGKQQMQGLACNCTVDN